MTTVTAHLYPQDTTNPANKIVDLTLASGIQFNEGERIEGDGQITLPLGESQTTSALSNSPRVVQIARNGTPVFEFYVTRLSRTLSDEQGGLVTFAGPGTRYALSAGQVYPYGNCPPLDATTQRILGYQDPSFSIAGLASVATYGPWYRQQLDNYFGDPTVRATNFPYQTANFITNQTGAVAAGEVLYFSPDFSVASDGLYVIAISADDEYDLFLVGTVIGQSRGKYRWKDTDVYPVTLCAGITYRLVIRGNNLSTPYDGTSGNIHWVIAGVGESSGDGLPLAADHIEEVSTDAESGTFDTSILITEYSGTVTIDFDETATDYQTKLETLVGAGNVTVSGQGTASKDDTYHLYTDATGGTFTLTVDGQTTTNIAYNATPAAIEAALEALSTVQEVTCNTGTGVSGDPWIFAFTGLDGETSFSVSVDDTNLTGGTGTATLTRVSIGTPYDPWVVTFTGILANSFVPVSYDGTNLVGGTVTDTITQVGHGGSSVIQTDTDWVMIPYPATPRGLTAGHMIRIVVEEAQARGVTVLDLLTLDFSDTLDSEGVAWAFELELAISPYVTSIADVIAFIELAGYDVRMAPGYVLQVSGDRGTNRTGTVNLTNARLGADSSFSVEKEIANVLLSETTDGPFSEATDAASITDNGRWEEPYSAPQSPLNTVLSWQQDALEDSADPYGEHTLVTVEETHPDGITDPIPFDDYNWADTITGPDIKNTATTLRVSATGLRVLDANDAIEYLTTVTES